ncbi:MAG TPA: MFS transporter [Dehalococcoidales bacterium]|nr:MFS transporter [Dehalococcoidales bacterium]
MAGNGMSGRRWYAVGLGAAINLIVFAMATACMPVLFSEIAGELGLSIVQVGTVWGVGSVGGIFSILTAGLLSDRFGARRILTVCCLLAGVFGALRGLSDSFTTLTITSLLFGLASEPVPVIVIKNVSLWFHERGLATAQGIIIACVGGGMMLGAMLSATVLSPLLGGWKHVMFFYGAISVLMGIIWFLTVPEPARSESPAEIRAPRQALSHVVRSRSIWLIAIGMMGFAGCNKGLIGYLPLYLRNIGWTATAADGTLAALSAAGTAAAVPLTLLSDKLGLRKAVLIPGLITTVISVGLLSVVTGPAVWLLAILAGVFRDMIWAVSATMAVETEGIGPVYAGTAVGIVHALTRVGYTFAPPAGNSLVLIYEGLPFVFWAGLSVLAVIVFLFVKETGRGRRTNPAFAD